METSNYKRASEVFGIHVFICICEFQRLPVWFYFSTPKFKIEIFIRENNTFFFYRLNSTLSYTFKVHKEDNITNFQWISTIWNKHMYSLKEIKFSTLWRKPEKSIFPFLFIPQDRKKEALKLLSLCVSW